MAPPRFLYCLAILGCGVLIGLHLGHLVTPSPGWKPDVSEVIIAAISGGVLSLVVTYGCKDT